MMIESPEVRKVAHSLLMNLNAEHEFESDYIQGISRIIGNVNMRST
jgi:hypothetical protein